MTEIHKGLKGIVVDETHLSYVDGEQGVLVYQGYNIHDLAPNATYEEVVYLLWHGELPNRAQLEELTGHFASEREVPGPVMDLMKATPKNAHPMAVLRTAVSALAHFDDEAEDSSDEANRRKAVRLTAKIPTIVTAFNHYRNGREPVAPDSSLSHAGNFLYMLNNEKPSETATRTFDICLVLHADHGFNASAFTGRCVAATLSDVYSAVSGAIGALKGPLHGGANTKVMELLLKMGSMDKVEPTIKDMLAKKERIMGFGHRVYRTEDPRATHLRKMSKELGEDKGDAKWFDMSIKIEELMKAEKGLNSNVDFYSASAYYALGIPIDLYTPIFALSRVAGWIGHVFEQYADNVLIRPRANYLGDKSGKTWVAIDDR